MNVIPLVSNFAPYGFIEKELTNIHNKPIPTPSKAPFTANVSGKSALNLNRLFVKTNLRISRRFTIAPTQKPAALAQ